MPVTEKLRIDSEALALLARIGGFLARQGVQGYLTGGFVRDILLGRDTADIDIAVTGDALDIAPGLAAALGGRCFPLDEVNRVGRIAIPAEATRTGEKWQIDLSMITGNIENDLSRRDFTVGAMAINLEQLDSIQLIDPFGGRDDARGGRIRAVSEAAFAADPVRLLRGIRLAAELGFTIDSETELFIQRHSHLVTAIAAERIREELVRLLLVPRSSEFLRYLDRLGLLTAIVPELAELKGVEQPPEHFWDVFNHSVETVAAVEFLLRQGTIEYVSPAVLEVVPWSEELTGHFAREVAGGSTRGALLKLAALLHDIAKPRTRAVHEDGRLRFLGHARQGADIAAGILERLRFSTREARLVETMVRHHLRPGQMGQEWQPTRRAIYRYFRDTGDAGVDTLFLSLADHLATRGPKLDLAGWQEHARMVEYVLAQRQQPETILPPKLIDGHDLINVLGVRPGPRIGELLELVREAQAAGEVATREEALAFVSDRLKSEGE